MKKKMSIAQFEEWSRFVSKIRDKALAWEIPVEQYYADIRRKNNKVVFHHPVEVEKRTVYRINAFKRAVIYTFYLTSIAT